MLRVKPNPSTHDHDDLYYNDQWIGFVPHTSKKRCLVKCPKCGRENYAMAVTTGVCAWCAYDVTKEDDV